jgi:hypothetical protein
MRKLIVKTLLIVLILFSYGSDSSFASEFEIVAKGGYFQYEEPSADVYYSGVVSGIQCDFNKTFSRYTIKAQSEYMMGNTTYDGQINRHNFAEGAAVTSAIEEYDIRYSSDIWYTDSKIAIGKWYERDNYTITPSMGIGYRYLNNPERSEIEGDYEREVAYLYLPLSLEMKKNISERKSWGIAGEIDILIHGWVKAHTSDASDNLNDLNFTQSLGGGLKLTGFYKQKIFGRDIAFSAFAELWLLGDSNNDKLMYDGTRMMIQSSDGEYHDYCEPANITTVLGVKLNLFF